MIQVHNGIVTMRRKICPLLLLLIVTVNQSQGYGIKGINSGSYSGSYSSASASAHSSSFSSSYSSDGHLPKVNEFPSASASANANAGANAGVQANAGAVAGSWAGTNSGAGVNSISGSTGGSYQGSPGSGSNAFAGNYGHGQSYDGTPDNKAAPVKYTSGSPSYGNDFAGGASVSSTSGSYGPDSGTERRGCCRGPFPGPKGSIHDYKPAPPGGGGPDPAWLQGGGTVPIHTQQTPHAGPSYTAPVSQGTTGLTSQIIHSFPGKPGSIHDHKPAFAGAAAAASATSQGGSNGPFPNGCGASNPDCSKQTGTHNTAYGSSTAGVANTYVTNGHHPNPSTSLDFIGQLPGHKGSIYDHKPLAQPTHSGSLPPAPTTTSSHTTTTLSPGSSAHSVIGKLPGPTTGIGYSKPATTSVTTSTNPAVDNVPLIHVIVPTVGGSGQTSTTTHKPSGFYSPASTTYTAGQTHAQSGTTGVAGSISTDLVPPEYSPNKQPTKPVYESTSENIVPIGGSHKSPLLPQQTPDTSGTPAYTSKPNTLSPYFQSSNPSKVPVNGICPFGSPNCHKSANIPEHTPGNSIVHPGTGNLPIDGSTAESYGPKTPPGYAGVPVVVHQPGCTGISCGTEPKATYPGNSPTGCSGTACGSSPSLGEKAPGYAAVPVCVGANCESDQKGNYPGNSPHGCSGSSCDGRSTPQGGFATGYVAVEKSPSSGCSGASCTKVPDSENTGEYRNTASGQTGYNAVPVAVQHPGCSGTNCESGPKGNYPSTSSQGCFGASCGGTSYGGSTSNSNSGSSAGFATGSVEIQKSPSSGCSGSTCTHLPGNAGSGSYPDDVNGAPGNGFATGSVVIQKENGQVTTGNDNSGSYYNGESGNYQPGSYNSGTNGANCIGDYCKHSGTNPDNGNDKPDQKHCSNGGCSSGIKGGENTAASGSYSSHQGHQGQGQGCGSGSCGNSGGAGISNSGSFSGSYSGSQFGSGNQNTGSYTQHGQPDGSGCAHGKCGTGGLAASGAGSYSSSYSSSGSGSGCGSGGCGPFGSFSGSSAYSSAGSGAGYGFPDFAKQFGGAFSKAFSASGSKSSASSFSGAIASSGGSY